MKRLIHISMLVIMALSAISCNFNKEDDEDPVKPGSIDRPYTTEEAVNAVSNLTWTSNTDFESTDIVYVKGRITEIVSHGYFIDSGTFGNASFTIASDETPDYKLFCYRILYFKNQKYVSGPDIEVGDFVIICGKLLNYKETTPETLSLEAYLFALN